MSYAKEVKKEIIEGLSDNACCRLAFLNALIRSCGEFGLARKQISVLIKTEFKELFDVVDKTLNKLYSEKAQISMENDSFNKSIRYCITISGGIATQLLIDCGIARINENNCFELIDSIDRYLLEDTCCKRAFVKGIFIGCGSISGVSEERHSTGYHFECCFMSEQVASDFVALLSEFDIFCKKVVRKGMHVVYLKSGEQISDVLALCEAGEKVIEFNQHIAMRSIINSVNRVSNCENANINKTVESCLQQLKAIEVIQETIGLDALNEDLAALCNLRLANQEESLSELCKLTGMTKSAINYRFNKILKIAKELSE